MQPFGQWKATNVPVVSDARWDNPRRLNSRAGAGYGFTQVSCEAVLPVLVPCPFVRGEGCNSELQHQVFTAVAAIQPNAVCP